MTRRAKTRRLTGLVVLLSLGLMALAVTLAVHKAKADAGGLVEVELKLPPPNVVGTPSNLPDEIKKRMPPPRPLGQRRPPFMAPRGTTNLALNRPVIGSDPEPTLGKVAMVTDGDKAGVEGSYVELGIGVQWVQIDLGQSCEIWALLVWHNHTRPRVYKDVVVLAGDDPDFIAKSTVIFNNDHDNTSGLGVGKDLMYAEEYEGILMPANGVKARYVRLYSKGHTEGDENHYTEVEVYGLPSK